MSRRPGTSRCAAGDPDRAGRPDPPRQASQASQASQANGESIVIGDVPHDWLFPRMAAVVHHAGAGTSAAGLAGPAYLP